MCRFPWQRALPIAGGKGRIKGVEHAKGIVAADEIAVVEIHLRFQIFQVQVAIGAPQWQAPARHPFAKGHKRLAAAKISSAAMPSTPKASGAFARVGVGIGLEGVDFGQRLRDWSLRGLLMDAADEVVCRGLLAEAEFSSTSAMLSGTSTSSPR